MHEFLLAQKCASINLKKWKVMPQIWITVIVITIFAIWNLSGVMAYSRAVGIRVAPWIFPHFFFIPIMVTVYGFLTVCLFAEAPFEDGFSQFMQIRVGKKIWICGQVLYVLEASTIYMLYYVGITIVILIPRLFLSMEWGSLIKQLSFDFSVVEEYGISLGGLFFSSNVVENFEPIQAMVLAMLMFWLVTVWLGTLIFVSHIVLKKGAGIIIGGFFVFLSYFSNYIGWIMLGNRVFYIAPLNWICLDYLDIGANGGLPDIWYAISVLMFGIIVFSVTGIKVYCVKED